MQLSGTHDQRHLSFDAVGIGQARVGGTDRRALFGVVKAHAFGAASRIDDKHRFAGFDRLVGAHGFTGPAVDAVVDDESGHRDTVAFSSRLRESNSVNSARQTQKHARRSELHHGMTRWHQAIAQ